MAFLSHLIYGLQLGAIYALVALGYSMVYGIIRLINFAHGDIIMVASFVVWYLIARLNVPVWLSILICVAFTSLLGVAIEKLAYKPLRHSARISLLITAIGISFFLQNWINDLLNVLGIILVIGIGIDNNISAQPQTGFQPSSERTGKA